MSGHTVKSPRERAIEVLRERGMCECGHAASDHAEGYVCTHKLDDPDAGFWGVCPCVLPRLEDE